MKKKAQDQCLGDKQILIEFLKVQRDFVKELNTLDWRVALIFVPLISSLSFVYGMSWELVSQEMDIYFHAFKSVAFICYLISLYGLWTVAKGQVWAWLRYKVITKISCDLNLPIFGRPEGLRFKKLWRVIACRRFILFLFYFFLAILSYSMILTPLTEWKFDYIWNPRFILIPLICAIIILVIHWRDYKLFKANLEKSIPNDIRDNYESCHYNKD